MHKSWCYEIQIEYNFLINGNLKTQIIGLRPLLKLIYEDLGCFSAHSEIKLHNLGIYKI